jgi:hypothetical protein
MERSHIKFYTKQHKYYCEIDLRTQMDYQGEIFDLQLAKLLYCQKGGKKVGVIFKP